jgi:hypothetical protein
MSGDSWKETRLWRVLTEAPEGEAAKVRATLERWMPDIEKILLAADTAPRDFTLHDATHSLRVAEWMARIIPDDVLTQLSSYEIALLLLSAYLHDIGMTPAQGHVHRHWRHLVFGKLQNDPTSESTPDEQRELQAWLFGEGKEITLPLAGSGRASEADLALGDELITHYCRHKHNAWSADWIMRHLANEKLGSYETWVADLIQLCGSHHEDYEDLRSDRFEPRLAGSSSVVHLRYLACVLRVADILDIDPERTPIVIFRHRSIARKSLLYWRKDHETWLMLDGQTLVVAATPSSAPLEKAIRDTADSIRYEVESCALLDRERPFSYWALRTSKPLPHRWTFPATVVKRIQSKPNTYIYIEGGFRPNTEKLIQLLSGMQLYGDPLAAVRELLQNAFDAVKESMALARLAPGRKPNDSHLIESIRALHCVELSLEERQGHLWLICKDSGVGMTRKIIEDHLLVSGAPKYSQVLELERRCKAAGFHLGRTAQFGLGVLGYFMLADRVEIQTRRSAHYQDHESTGWIFETEGVGDFGELRPDLSANEGTEVRLRLRTVAQQDFGAALGQYLHKLLVHLPCRLQWVDQCKGEQRIWPAGWAWSEEAFSEATAYEFAHDRSTFSRHFSEFLPRAARDQIEENDQMFASAHKEMTALLRTRMQEGALPGNLGIYRVTVLYFDLEGGESAVFLRLKRTTRGRQIESLEGGKSFAPPAPQRFGFEGLLIEHDGWKLQTGLSLGLEISWQSSKAGSMSVDRKSFSLSPAGVEAVKWANEQGKHLVREVFSEASSFATLNAFSEGAKLDGVPEWILEDRGSGHFYWRKLDSPFVMDDDFDVGGFQKQLVWCGERVALIGSLRPLGIGREWKPVWWAGEPDRIVLVGDASSGREWRVVRLWTRFHERGVGVFFDTVSGLFPPRWPVLCGASFRDALVWRKDHALVNAHPEFFKNLHMAHELVQKEPVDTMLSRLENSPTWGAIILAYSLACVPAVWTGLVERAPSLIKRIWREIFGDQLQEIGFWSHGLTVVSIRGQRTIERAADLDRYMPDPGLEWKLTGADQGRTARKATVRRRR